MLLLYGLAILRLTFLVVEYLEILDVVPDQGVEEEPDEHEASNEGADVGAHGVRIVQQTVRLLSTVLAPHRARVVCNNERS